MRVGLTLGIDLALCITRDDKRIYLNINAMVLVEIDDNLTLIMSPLLIEHLDIVT